MEIRTVRELANAFRQGKYSSTGCYPLFFLTSDGGALSHDAVRENYMQIARAVRDGLSDGWRVIAHDVNWEDAELFCDHTGNRIESAYNEPEEAL